MSRTTLAAPAGYLLEVKKSRFLAQAQHIASAEAALAQLDVWRDPTATHNCWATRCGQHYRFSDDGEPAGTAGRPILAAIDGAGLDEVVVMVTRRYGGIKLGAGGLVRAYSGAAAHCLREAPKREIVAMVELKVRCGFEHAGSIHHQLDEHSAVKLEEQFNADGVQWLLQLPVDRESALRQALRDATRGQVDYD